jgi:hypothetical protein
MKQIQPVSIWYNGQMIQATIFNMTSIGDNLSTSATFFYQLLSTEKQELANGNLILSGFDYEAYSTSPDSNAYAYQWGATQLNLILV